MANLHSDCTQAQTEQQQQKPSPSTIPSIQVPPPHPPPPEDQSPRSTSSNPSPRPLRSPGGTGKHPVYRGIRSRSGKWVSEIREPRKTTRIWLGTYPAPDMAAAAYDVAALALKGPDTPLNFQNYRESYPMPKSNSATDIRAAAAGAAASRRVEMRTRLNQDPSPIPDPNTNPSTDQVEKTTTSSSSCSKDIDDQSGQEFIDEEAILNMPNLLVHMAGGMLVSPPRINTPSSDDSPENSDVEGLWSF